MTKKPVNKQHAMRMSRREVPQRRCNRCRNIVYKSEVQGYVFSCNYCDEDLYTFETYLEDGGTIDGKHKAIFQMLYFMLTSAQIEKALRNGGFTHEDWMAFLKAMSAAEG